MTLLDKPQTQPSTAVFRLNDPLTTTPPLFQTRPVTSTLKSFEETYKTSYSHGLESIYALESVDIKSVKKLEVPIKAASPTKKKSKPLSLQIKNNQLEFELGLHFDPSIESFLPRESIQVLGLFRHAEKCLLENGKKILRDLIDVDLQEFIFFKGMGQGYVDEIRSKLAAYLEGRTIWRTETLDFASWIRSLVGGLDRKKTAAVLREFRLGDLIELSAVENIEIGRISPDQLQQYKNELFSTLQTTQRELFFQDFKRIVDVFVKPWIRNRLGLATSDEILERIEKVSLDPAYMEPALFFFESVFRINDKPSTSILQSHLFSVDNHLFSADRYIKKHYHWVNQAASSYFYKMGICYTFSELVSFIEREMALEWVSVANGFVEKALRLSPHFRVRKDFNGKLVIRCA